MNLIKCIPSVPPFLFWFCWVYCLHHPLFLSAIGECQLWILFSRTVPQTNVTFRRSTTKKVQLIWSPSTPPPNPIVSFSVLFIFQFLRVSKICMSMRARNWAQWVRGNRNKLLDSILLNGLHLEVQSLVLSPRTFFFFFYVHLHDW